MNEMIMFRCKRCHAVFSIDMETLRQMELNRKYITCVVDGRHKKRDIEKLVSIKDLMQERSAVNI